MIFPGHKDHPTALPRVSVNGNWQDIGYFEVLMSGAPFALWNRGRRVNVGVKAQARRSGCSIHLISGISGSTQARPRII